MGAPVIRQPLKPATPMSTPSEPPTRPDPPADAAPLEEEDGRDEGFAGYYAAAQELGKDLNEYLEEDLAWGDCYHLLEPTTFPYLRPDAVVLELGAGSGRWSRHIVERLPAGTLFLVDNSPWKVN